MSGVIDLVEMLKKTGSSMSQGIIDAILTTEPSDFTDFPLESFWQDYPAVSYTHLTLPTIYSV